MKRFKRGLVVGKFSPLHRGHEWLIRRAVEGCDDLAIISYSQPEFAGCEAERRAQWLAELFPQTRRLVLTDATLRAHFVADDEFSRLPSNEADAQLHRRFCGFLCAKILKFPVEAIFSSEAYGPGFAQELTRYFRATDPTYPEVQHLMVDPARSEIPISGTRLRADIHGLKHYLSPAVYASFVERIALLGGESSGKSTLAQALATHYQTSHVSEYGRELWEEKAGALAYDDLLVIAQRQVEREERQARTARRFLFCDTTPLTTLFYCRDLFGQAPAALEKLAERAYALVVLCAPDFAFVQDGTRRDEAFRQRQHAWYLAELRARGIEPLVVTGSLPDRIRQVEDRIGAKG